MRKSKSKVKQERKQRQVLEIEEISLLNQWIDAQKPDSGSNPLALQPLPQDAPVGKLHDGSFSRYAGCAKFSQLPLSKRTKDALKQGEYVKMTDIQRASLPHSLCERDILGAAKTGSGKTLAFVIPVLEKLHRERWGPLDGVGAIIMSPTRELAGQLFDVLKAVGKYHSFSAGLLIGGRKDIDMEKERVHTLNILVCTPGRLKQHMDETPNFECSELQVLVLDEADRMLDQGFRKDLDAIIPQLPKHRQTLLFSATQTKSVKDLARLSLKNPEYLSVHEEASTATPNLLQQTAMVVPLEQKLDMLWSFIKAHLSSRILVFLSSCKQVKFVFEAFKKLRPGIPLKCLHGRMKQERRMGIYSQFCEKRSVLFSTDVASRGLDFNKSVDWVVQVDCPDDVASYIHRVGRTARYLSGGRSVLFVMPSEIKMLEKLQAAKIPIQTIKPNNKRLQPVSSLLSSLLVKYPDMQQLAQRAFITYLRSIHIQKDKEVFDVMKLPVDEFSASMGIPMTPKVRFLNQKMKNKKTLEKSAPAELEKSEEENATKIVTSKEPEMGNFMKENIDRPKEKLDIGDSENEDLVLEKDTISQDEVKAGEVMDIMPTTRVLKKKKLKINVNRPAGSRVVFDEEGNSLPPLATMADRNDNVDDVSLFDKDKREEHYKRMREDLKQADKEDKLLDRQRRREKRIKQKMKRKGGDMEEEDDGDGEDYLSGSEGERTEERKPKRSKIYFDSDVDDDGKMESKENAGIKTASISLAEQEAIALKLLSSMHS